MQTTSNKIVSIIVVTCGKHGLLKSCLDSLKKQTFPDIEIIIIDNSADSDFAAEIRSSYPSIKIHSNPRNFFYCQALNQGIAASRGIYLLCLNDDVFLDKDYIREAIKGFEYDPGVGLVSGKIMRSDKKTIDSTGLFLSLYRTAKERGYGTIDRSQFEKDEYIFGVNGAVAFYRKAMLEEIKRAGEYFDPALRIFYEDLDIAWRAQEARWRGFYAHKAVALHVRGGTVRNAQGINKAYARRFLSDELNLLLIRNRYAVIIKNTSLLDLFLHLPFIVLFELFSWSYIALSRPKLIKKVIFDTKYFREAVRKRGVKDRK